MKKLEAVKLLYTALGGSSSTVAGADTTLDVLNAILGLGSVAGEDFIGDAIAAIAENAESILPSGAPVLQDKTVTPTTSTQTITADEGKDGLGTVTVSAVTAAIDENITAGNIKSGVTILGVEGTYSGT
ncbi:hypothetical protein [Ruminococcus flavefaciens]|uniref:hypothetical protein n=1 Tax=Ruminococcus flavefaciens TaxID=1265 RepID=UPI003F102816